MAGHLPFKKQTTKNHPQSKPPEKSRFTDLKIPTPNQVCDRIAGELATCCRDDDSQKVLLVERWWIIYSDTCPSYNTRHLHNIFSIYIYTQIKLVFVDVLSVQTHNLIVQHQSSKQKYCISNSGISKIPGMMENNPPNNWHEKLIIPKVIYV